MASLARFQNRYAADLDVVDSAFRDAGFAAERLASRLRPGTAAEAVLDGGRTVALEASWRVGRGPELPVFTVTLRAPLGGGAFWCKQTLRAGRGPLPVPGAERLAADGAPRGAVSSALAGELGRSLAALTGAVSHFTSLVAEDDTVTLTVTGWPPGAREVEAAVAVCVQVAELLIATAPGASVETQAFRATKRRRDRRAEHGRVAVMAVLGSLILALTAFTLPV